MNKLKIITDDFILKKIVSIRNQNVMLDQDLAELYGVPTKVLNQAVKRNSKRFPDDFHFQLNDAEFESLKSQFVTSKRGGRRSLPNAFTEQGVAMLSSVLNSDVAIEVNIQIIRIFTKMRTLISKNTDILLQLERVENRLLMNQDTISQHEDEIALIFKYLKKLLKPSIPERKRIGFKE
jgi:hypothetical protein